MKTLSVVIPAYNEQDGIVQIINRVRAVSAALAAQDLALELIVVDDGSQDKTTALASQCANTRVIRHFVNRGYGAALKTGFRHASGNYIGFLDADGTYPPEAFPELCRALEMQNADLVVGSRMSGAVSEMPVLRRIGNLVFAGLLSLLSGVRVRDSASGMRVFRREILPRIYPLPDGLDLTPAMTTRAIHENLKIVETPIAYAERIGRSKLSVVRDGMRFTNTIVWTTMTYNPVRVWGGLGLGMGALAILLAALLALDWLAGNVWLGALAPIAAFTMLVLGVLGASVFSLGVMFSYLIAIFTDQPVHRGMFGRVIFDPPLDYSFGWMGLLSASAGIVVSIGAFLMSLQGTSLTQLWLWFLLGALLSMVGVQLGVAYVVIRVLDELTRRHATAQRDLVEPESDIELLDAPGVPVNAS
ncbi:MAG: glycosyltransferase family 2 protein [Chloroflexi bacterium]|nr:glycosyltransferase family 2 protein [Chloroflexota bacterium]